ncbi:MAG: CpsD/CapB family tyrosine-protein kinase [Terriglobales bacterium]
MSYIFEALQRAEAERTGATAPVPAESVSDLLQELDRTEAKAEHTDAILPMPAAPALEPDKAGTETFAQSRVIVPKLTSDSRLVCMTDQGSAAAEQFRVLGLKLRHLRERRKLKRLVITGTAPQEGKSLVAANLALNQARSKVLRTLLVDGDLRRPTLADRFGFGRSMPGLSECLAGELELGEAVYKISGTGLWFMPAGRTHDNPLELMQAGRVAELLERAGTFFDWIIIDTPPVTPVAETSYWMKLADGVLVVIREGISEKKTVEKAISSFESSRLLGVVVNSCSSNENKDYYSRYAQARASGPNSGKSEVVSSPEPE